MFQYETQAGPLLDALKLVAPLARRPADGWAHCVVSGGLIRFTLAKHASLAASGWLGLEAGPGEVEPHGVDLTKMIRILEGRPSGEPVTLKWLKRDLRITTPGSIATLRYGSVEGDTPKLPLIDPLGCCEVEATRFAWAASAGTQAIYVESDGTEVQAWSTDALQAHVVTLGSALPPEPDTTTTAFAVALSTKVLPYLASAQSKVTIGRTGVEVRYEFKGGTATIISAHIETNMPRLKLLERYNVEPLWSALLDVKQLRVALDAAEAFALETKIVLIPERDAELSVLAGSSQDLIQYQVGETVCNVRQTFESTLPAGLAALPVDRVIAALKGFPKGEIEVGMYAPGMLRVSRPGDSSQFAFVSGALTGDVTLRLIERARKMIGER